MDEIRGPLHQSNRPLLSKNESRSKDSGFADILKDFCQSVNTQINTADRKIEAFANGQPMDIHEVVIATEKADISLQFLIQIRNKLLEGYQEIMRLQF